LSMEGETIPPGAIRWQTRPAGRGTEPSKPPLFDEASTRADEADELADGLGVVPRDQEALAVRGTNGRAEAPAVRHPARSGAGLPSGTPATCGRLSGSRRRRPPPTTVSTRGASGFPPEWAKEGPSILDARI
jgi:hypothetical protein